MAGSKISARTDGAPALRTDIVPIARTPGVLSVRVTVGDIVDVARPIVVGGATTTSTLTLKPTTANGIAGADIIFAVGNSGATEAMRILNNATVGLGTTTTTDANGNIALNIRGAVNTDILGVTDGTRQVGMYFYTTGVALGTVSNHRFDLVTNNGAARLSVMETGGIILGAPTGGDKGAGTLNVDTGIYLDGVLLIGAKDTSISTGVGSIKMKSANAADNAAWIPIVSSDGTVYYVPGWTTNNP